MILIIESGATKSDWLAISRDGRQEFTASLAGMNISTAGTDFLAEVIAGAAALLPCDKISEVFLYTAGVPSEEKVQILRKLFLQSFPGITSFCVESDLLAAARAVCGHDSGIAAIIGTGSNSCFYDGGKITEHVNCGGFIIGDEGSAAKLGSIFLADHIKGLVPAEVDDDFNARFDGSYSGIVSRIYSAAAPSAYLGSIAPFILSHYSNPYIKEMVDGNFKAFFSRCICRYPKAPIGFAGGFAWACRGIISEIAAEYGLEISCFVKSPIENLAAYHLG